jgi:hypothetical protein
MLIQKSSKIDVGDIISFKLANGDEIIGKIAEETPTDYVVSKPCLVVPSQQGIGLMQAMFSSDPEASIPISKAHIMMKSATLDKLQQHYIKTTTSLEILPQGSMLR